MPAWSRERWTSDAEAIVEMGNITLRMYRNRRWVTKGILVTVETLKTRGRIKNMRLLCHRARCKKMGGEVERFVMATG